MEKFEVDLERVLNEFEYNEERRESGPTLSIRTPHSSIDSMGALRQQPPSLPLPATIYRKPSFERINLADANFAASPPKPSGLNFSHGLYERPRELAYSHKPQVVNNRNYSQEPSLTNEINSNKQVINEHHNFPLSEDWENTTIPVHSEEKPDLLEYNSTTADSDLNGEEIHNQLPDITTSVNSSHNVNNNENDLPNSLDLISSANGTLLTENNKAYFTSNDQETSLESDYFTFNDRILVEEIDHLVPSVNNGLNDVTLTSDHVPVQVETKGSNTADMYDNSEGIEQVQTQFINTDENNRENHRKGKYETLNKNDLDFERNNEIDNNICESKQDLSKTLHEHQEEEVLSGNKTKDCINECAVETKIVEKPKVIGFGNDEDFSQGELIEYLESIHKDFEEDLNDQVPCSEESIELPSENRIDTSINNIESTIDISKNNTLPVNSLQSNSEHSTDLSTKIISQGSFGGNCSYKLDYLPQKKDNQTRSESVLTKVKQNKSNLSDLESKKSNIAIALDYTNELKIKTNSLKYNEPEKSTNTIQHSTITKEQNQDESVISTSSVQTIEAKSKNPFDQDGFGYNKPEIEAKIRSNNPFEDNNEESPERNNENPFKNNTGNPFEDSPENPFEDNCGDLDEDLGVSEVSQQSTRCNDSQEIKPVDKSMISNNSAFSRASVSDITRETSESLQEKSSSIVAGSLIQTALNVTEKSILSSQNDIEKISIPSTPENEVKRESASEENPSTDCSPSGSSLDSEPSNDSLCCSAKMIPIKQAVESSLDGLHLVDEAGIPAEEDRPLRPNSLELPQKITVESNNPQSAELSEPGASERETVPEDRRLGKIAPFWIPDSDTTNCMQCQLKFTVIRRRHHCRACGQVLCSKCCGLKARIEYMDFVEARVCQPCFTILEAVSASEAASPQRRRPNPNNPMEYCSTIPPLEQAKGSLHQPPPSVMVPVSVLKREGRKSDVTKQVMFSDGIRPGGDLTELDGSTEPRMPFRRSSRLTKRVGTPPGGVMSPSMRRVMDSSTLSFIPSEGDSILPPVVTRRQGEVNYLDLESPIELNQPVVKFALNRNLFVLVKRVLLDCCVNRECWCCSSEGLACVGQDEVVFLLEYLPQETQPPKDIFLLINVLYQDAAKGSTVSEMSFTPATSNNLLGSRDHGGFLYIRTSYHCTAQLALPSPPYLVAILVHRWETPWARLFPIRLMLRLGAEFRYYPCPLVSVRNREPLYTDIGHTIINILADFRKYSYTLPSVRGLVIHMEDRQTTVNIPRNRYDQVVRALNNSNDSVLAFGANLSLAADSHLVCMQTSEHENTSYHTQAINIHNKPHKVTGASFVVFNGALKVPGLAGKSNIVEDGLMVQVPNETMAALRTALRDMRDYSIGCGPNAEETVLLQWTADDTNFNIGVKSCIDGKPLDGVPSIRVHNGTDYSGGVRLIRWTEVFILQCEDSDHANEPLDISRLSESIARATCLALVPLLDLLSAASLTTLAVRTTIHPDNVGYEAGSNGEKLPPLYMKSLDNELVAVVHQAALASQENPAILELVFRIMEQG